MAFENCIKRLKLDLNLKYSCETSKKPVIKTKVNERRRELINKIEMILNDVMKDVANYSFPAFNLLAHHKWENCIFDDRVKIKNIEWKRKRIDFKRRNSRADFARIVFLLSKVHEALTMERRSTRRELYYENVNMFERQKQVDDGMRVICHLLDAPTWELNVVATSKGVVAGPVVLTLATGESVDCSGRGGVSIPANVTEIEEITSAATWVLIVEKDASFQRLLTSDAFRKLGSCILVTGKGFPDVNSRILVRKFWELLRIPILALVDADPHGIEIMCVYRFGSLSMAAHSGDLACPAVRWLGVHPADIRPLLLDSKTLSPNDLKKIRSLLNRRYVETNENLRIQLKILLEGNEKAEIEGVTSISSNFLTDVYIRNKIETNECF